MHCSSKKEMIWLQIKDQDLSTAKKGIRGDSESRIYPVLAWGVGKERKERRRRMRKKKLVKRRGRGKRAKKT